MSLSTSQPNNSRVRLAFALVAAALTWPVVAQPPLPDLCGCRNHPGSLGSFDLRDKNTWPPGTVQNPQNLRLITMPLPADGVLVFDSINFEFLSSVHGSVPVEVRFQRNAANTPVTILVKGNVNIGVNTMMLVSGDTGSGASASSAGLGGLGGPGGFRGGDGAFRIGNLAADGGAGLGPGGGIGATGTPATGAGGATFTGAVDLLPLVGGAGGGGGRSTNAVQNCAGGGGGGGGGGILIAANGTITINSLHGAIVADGGSGGAASGFTCSSGGGGGSGGAVRLIANTIVGSGRVYARNGARWEDGAAAGTGRIRMEAATNTFPVNFADPIASRSSTPGPIVNPFNPSVSVTGVAGQPVPTPPQGGYAGVDIQVAAPGPTAIDLSTEGVPTGTSVEVKIKPRVGGATITQPVTLSNCDATGRCLANVTVDLAAGTYSIEARATFQSQD